MPDQDFKKILDEWAKERRSVDESTHKLHHKFLDEGGMDFVETMIIKAEKREVLWDKAKGTFVGGVAMAVLGGITWVGNLVIEAWKS